MLDLESDTEKVMGHALSMQPGNIKAAQAHGWLVSPSGKCGARAVYSSLEPASMDSLLLQLAFSVCVCLLGGLITGLLTWWLEDGIYQKIKKSRSL